MIHSEKEIINHINQKIEAMVGRKRIDPSFKIFLSEKELFFELNARTYQEQDKIRMLASSAIDGWNYISHEKMGTDIEDYEMLKAEMFREEYIELPLQSENRQREIGIDYSDPTGDWLKNNIFSSGDRRDQDLPGPILTLFLIGFCILVAFLDLGSDWYEVILKIIAFIFGLSFGFIIYSIITNVVARSNFFLKPLIHFLLLLIFPLIIYICIKIYFL